MYSAGRQGQTEHLDAETQDWRSTAGRIFVDDQFQTKVDHIYAVGDVIGFPALAALDGSGRLARPYRLRRAGEEHDGAAADRHLLHSRGVLRRRHGS